MTDTTTSPVTEPVANAPMSFDEGVEAIAGLLDDAPETDHVKADMAPASTEAATENQTVEVGEEELVLDDDELEGAAETAPETPPATIGDDFEVTLDDGTKISLGQLKRNNLFQRDYSKKTEELARFKEAEEAKIQTLRSEAEAEIRQQRDFILNYAQRFIPQPPNPALNDENSPEYDPFGYWKDKERYEAEVQQFNALVQHREAEQNKLMQQQAEQQKEHLQQEFNKLVEAMPKLKEQAARDAFRKDAEEIGGKVYGITPDEIRQIGDHRYMRILHDALQYRKAVEKAAAVKKEVAAKPKLVQQQRMAPQAIQDRDRAGRFKALRESGSIDAAAKAIEALL